MRRATVRADARAAHIALLVGLVLALPGVSPAHAIVGGSPADRADYPFFVEVELTDGSCGGMLVAPDRVVTAAHCGEGLPAEPTVRVGPARTQVTVAHRGYHPAYLPALLRFQREFPPPPPDVLLLGLAEPVRDTVPVTLPAPDATFAVGTSARIIGTGASRPSGAGAGPFRQAEVALEALADCRPTVDLGDPLVRTWTWCTRDPDGKKPFRSACYGDSGSPMLVGSPGKWTAIGVDSWGPDCGAKGQPEIWASLVPALDFIRDPSPEWAPRAAGPPRLVGTARVGGEVTCRPPAWIDPPRRVRTIFIVGRLQRQFGPRRTYVLEPRDAGLRVRCAVFGSSAGGNAGTADSNALRVAAG